MLSIGGEGGQFSLKHCNLSHTISSFTCTIHSLVPQFTWYQAPVTRF